MFEMYDETGGEGSLTYECHPLIHAFNDTGRAVIPSCRSRGAAQDSEGSPALPGGRGIPRRAPHLRGIRANLTATAREKNGACPVPSPRAPNRTAALNRSARGEGMKGSGVVTTAKNTEITKKRAGFSVPHSPCIPSPRGRSYSVIERARAAGRGDRARDSAPRRSV